LAQIGDDHQAVVSLYGSEATIGGMMTRPARLSLIKTAAVGALFIGPAAARAAVPGEGNGGYFRWSRGGLAFVTLSVLAIASIVAVQARPAEAAVAMCQGEAVTILGTDAVETIDGTNGDDVISGLGGADTVNGNGGNDVVCGGEGDDVIHGDAGEIDLISGDAGNDMIDGGAGGTDGAVYAFAGGPVTADLNTGHASGEGTDTLSGVEGVVGSQFNDQLSGDGSAFNWFAGVPGNDAIDGRGGFDAVFYTFATGPVIVNLRKGRTSGEGNDTLASIEGASGGLYGDVLSGNAAVNILLGREGNDTINGGRDADVLAGDLGNDAVAGGRGGDTLFGGAGDDTFTGGAGSDVVAYSNSPRRITASLLSGRARGEGADTFTKVEALSGSPYTDVLSGNARSNRLGGEGGHDQLRGRAGNDMLSGGDGRDKGNGGPGADFCELERRARCEARPGQGLAPEPPPPPRALLHALVESASASTLVGTSQRAGAIAGVAAALSARPTVAATEFTFPVALNVERPVCYPGSHQTSLNLTVFAKGNHYVAYLVYWTGSRWLNTGIFFGPMSRVSGFQPGFIATESLLPIYTFWQLDNGGDVPLGNLWWTVPRFGTYYAWAETFIDPGTGSRLTRFMGDHQTIYPDGASTYNWYCRLY
jgi:Ca2+-binding RTX toxin-like protein